MRQLVLQAILQKGLVEAIKNDKINFYYFSRGSCFEVRSYLYSGKTVGYFTVEQIKDIDVKCMKVVEELNRIIKGLGS